MRTLLFVSFLRLFITGQHAKHVVLLQTLRGRLQPIFAIHRPDAVAAEEQRVKQMLKDPDQAKAFLVNVGFITRSDKLAKRYRD